MNKIYYAHSKQIYDTVCEINEYAYIFDHYSPARIINPAHLDLKGMKKYMKVVKKCDLVVVSEFEGFIGRGVFCEIATALIEGIKVEVLRKTNGKYTLTPVIGIQINKEHDWKREYAKIITN